MATPLLGLKWQIFDDFPAALGESPVWDDRRNCLWWIESRSGSILRRDLDSSGMRTERSFGRRIGSIGLTEYGRIVIAFSQSVAIWNPESDDLAPLCDLTLGANEILNDGKTGPDGTFWVGSKGRDADGQGTGRLFRICGAGSITVHADGLITSNGLAWSFDNRAMFLSDSKGEWIDRFDFDRTPGVPSHRKRMREGADEAFGRPDGAATDQDDTYWSCGVSAGRVNRFTRDGDLIEHLPTPIAAPTMVCFGGNDLQTVFLTSLRGKNASKHCGKVFSAKIDVAGVPLARFRESA
tara:strand:- start:6491 stop:7375 length:885 start_codon:yes stop_codon:yes gene_type:complete